MADELQLVTTNAASDGWVDGVPGAVSTGYQAQNTALQALFNGVDKSSCSVSGSNLVIAAGGLIDDSGLPFVITEAITLALPTTGAANWFLRVVPGSTALERSIEFTDDRGTYDAAKNGFYDSDGYRVLTWIYNINSLILSVDNYLQNGSVGNRRSEISIGSKEGVALSGTPLKMEFGPLYLDNKFEVDEATSTITIKNTGNYTISLTTIAKYTSGGSPQTITYYIYKNGSSYITGDFITSEYTPTGSENYFSTSLQFAKNDTIEIYMKTSTGVSSGAITQLILY